MTQRIPMTPTGHQKVLADCKHHKEVLRPRVVKDIEEARAHGDISENSEYDDAKDRQGHIEARIREYESRLSLAEVVDVTKIAASDLIIFGTTVEVEDVDNGDLITLKLVGTEEVDARAGFISYISPLGKALIGRRVGDEVKFETPKGTRTVVVNAVHYK